MFYWDLDLSYGRYNLEFGSCVAPIIPGMFIVESSCLILHKIIYLPDEVRYSAKFYPVRKLGAHQMKR